MGLSKAGTQAQNLATTSGATAGTIEDTLLPELNAALMGKSTPASAAANTAAQQSEGGSLAATLGYGNSEAARTENAGAFAPAAGVASRRAGANLAQIAAQQKAEGANSAEKALQGLYGVNSDATLKALDLANTAENSTFGHELGSAVAGGIGKGIGEYAEDEGDWLGTK